MKTGWSLTDNPFETSTRGNYTKMFFISRFTNAVLQHKISDPFFLNLYNIFHPVFDNYLNSYNEWGAGKGIKKGETLNVSQLLKKLSHPLIGRWNGMVQVEYARRTPRYAEIFPQGVKHFHNGSREDRISTVTTLAKSIDSDAALAALKAEVDAFVLQLTIARRTQLGSKGNTKTKSGDVEKLRKKLAVAMMVVYGNLVVLYADKLDWIEPFFDLETLRDKRQKTFTRKLKAGQSKTLVKRSLSPDSELKLHNTGTGEIMIGLCPAKAMVCTTGVTVDAGATLTVTAQQLGAVEECKYLTVTNIAEQEGSCVVTLL